MRSEVAWFAELMEIALQRKDAGYNGNSWKTVDADALIQALEEHLVKLKHRRTAGKGNQQLIYDATDIGNFAMMIADAAALAETKNNPYALGAMPVPLPNNRPLEIIRKPRFVIMLPQEGTDKEIEWLRTFPGLTIIDATDNRLFLVEGNEDIIRLLTKTRPLWAIASEKTYSVS